MYHLIPKEKAIIWYGCVYLFYFSSPDFLVLNDRVIIE
jgi:hypothetical protein